MWLPEVLLLLKGCPNSWGTGATLVTQCQRPVCRIGSNPPPYWPCFVVQVVETLRSRMRSWSSRFSQRSALWTTLDTSPVEDRKRSLHPLHCQHSNLTLHLQLSKVSPKNIYHHLSDFTSFLILQTCFILWRHWFFLSSLVHLCHYLSLSFILTMKFFSVVISCVALWFVFTCFCCMPCRPSLAPPLCRGKRGRKPRAAPLSPPPLSPPLSHLRLSHQHPTPPSWPTPS